MSVKGVWNKRVEAIVDAKRRADEEAKRFTRTCFPLRRNKAPVSLIDVPPEPSPWEGVDRSSIQTIDGREYTVISRRTMFGDYKEVERRLTEVVVAPISFRSLKPMAPMVMGPRGLPPLPPYHYVKFTSKSAVEEAATEMVERINKLYAEYAPKPKPKLYPYQEKLVSEFFAKEKKENDITRTNEGLVNRGDQARDGAVGTRRRVHQADARKLGRKGRVHGR